MSNSWDPDQVKHFVSHDLGPNCLQRLTADDTRQRVSNTLKEPSSYHNEIFDKYVGASSTTLAPLPDNWLAAHSRSHT